MCFKAILGCQCKPENRVSEIIPSLMPFFLPDAIFPPFLPLTLLAFVVRIISWMQLVCGCGLINLCSKLLLHTVSLPIDLQVLRARASAKVWRCGTSGGNRPRPNCLFFVSWSYWQLPLSLPLHSRYGKTNQSLLIAMAFSSSQIKHFHTSQERQHPLRPLVRYCKYSTELRAGQAHYHHHHSQDVMHSPWVAVGI